jgi:hypothetical protein
MSYPTPRKDASVENLLSLCEILREGPLSRDELYDEADIGRSLVSDTIEYGNRLGFLEGSEEEIKATERGIAASYYDEADADLEEYIVEGICDYDLYRMVLKTLASEAQENGVVTKNDIVRTFRTEMGLSGSESTLGDAAITFLQTLDAGGCGDYIVGRRGKESRIEVSDDFGGIVEKIATVDTDTEQSNGQISSKSGTDFEADPEISEETTQSQQGIGQVEIGKHKPQNQTQSDSFSVSLELNGDEEPENVEQLILAIRRGLEKDLSGNSTKTEEEQKSTTNNQEFEGDSDSSDQSLDSFMSQDTTNDEDGSANQG